MNNNSSSGMTTTSLGNMIVRHQSYPPVGELLIPIDHLGLVVLDCLLG